MSTSTQNSGGADFEAELHLRTQRFSMLDLISHPVWIFDIDRRCVHWANSSAIGIWNACSLHELCSRDMGRDMSESVAQRLAQYQSDFTAGGAVFNEQWTLYPGDVPTSLHVRFNGYALPDGRMAMLCHAKPKAQETPESLRSVEALLHTPVMITLYDSQGVALYRNPAARASTQVLTQTLAERIVDPGAYARLMQAHQTEELSTFTLAVHTESGEQWHELSVRRCRDAVTGQDAMLVSEADVSALKYAEAKANFQARHDGLTGLPNRAHVIVSFAAAVEEVRRRGSEAALIFIDLDHFKDINDTLGHVAGDELLILVAERLRKATRNTDLVARLGGDEFLILVSSHDILAEVDQVRLRVLHSIAQPTLLRGTEVRVTPTMGVSLFPRDGTDLETLLRKADLAMYSGKAHGRNELAYYDDSMGTAVTTRMSLENDLRHALERQEFEVHYQPMICSRTRRIVGAEALVRWRHPERGLMAPDSFIPICENTGMILPLGRLVFEHAAHQQAAWARLDRPIKIHVNLSPRQFADPELVQHMQTTLARAGCMAGSLGVEITESILLGGNDHAETLLRAISTLGLSIALDDFGTGYSNLAYLQRYPINTLKIDKAFIQSSSNERPLADLIVSLCRTLSMEVVAEGVETQEQMDWVVGRNIAQAQGYLFSKPLPPVDFLTLLIRD